MNRIRWQCNVLASLLFLLAIVIPNARGQAVGEILGSVFDPSGAVIANSKVTAVQNGTGMTRTTVTSSSGTYFLTSLPVGTFVVTAEAAGFKPASSVVTLDVDQHREVNFTLTPAGTAESVQVSAAPPLLNTTNGTLGGLVTGEQVATLPLNGRDITNLAFLQPGVNYDINSGAYYGSIQWSTNGNRGMTVVGMLDGSDTSDTQLGGAQVTNFNLDAIAEFKVVQNSYSAEYGHGAGAALEIISKSGTNSYHGSLFEFVRNSAFDSRNFFSDDVPPFKRNEFGGTLGGPFVIPKVYNGKDHTFFFVEYAGYRQRRGSPVTIPVPTASERQGIFNITGSDGQPDQLLVPLSATSKYVLNAYPLPNDPTGPDGARTLNFEYSLPENHDQWSTRLDQQFSSKDSLYARFTSSHNRLPTADPVAALESVPFSEHDFSDQQNSILSETHVFSPTLLNTARASLQYFHGGYLPGVQTLPQTTFQDGSYANWGPDTSITNRHNYLLQFSDGINWVRGRHSLSFGGEYRRLLTHKVGTSSGGPNGQYSFATGTPLPVSIPSASGDNNLAAGTPSPSSIVSFMVGAPAYYERTLSFPGFGPTGGGYSPYGLRQNHLNGYVQDDIHASRKLMINVGLRYEFNSVPHEVDNRMAGIVDDPKLDGGQLLYQQVVLNPKPLYFPDYRGFGPRFGLAYKLSDKTVLRGGWGIFTNLIPNTYPDQQALNFPFAASGTTLLPPYFLAVQPVSGTPVLSDLKGNPLPPNGNTKLIPPNTPVNLAPAAAFFGGQIEGNWNDMNLHNGYTMDGNVTVEQNLPGDSVMQVSYVSNNAVHLWGNITPNAFTGALPQYTPYTDANPGLGEIYLMDNHAHSTYNALQAMVRKVSPSHGLQYQASYTWSKAIDNATTVYTASVPEGAALQQNPFCYACEKAPSGFDFTHTFTMNIMYMVPLDRWMSMMPKRLVHGWELGSIIRAQSGYPFTVTSPFGTIPYGTDTYDGYQPTRPDLVQPASRNPAKGSVQYFSNAVVADGTNLTQQYFVTPGCLNSSCAAQTRPGDLGRNTFRGDPFSNVDFSLIKDTKLKENAMLQFRAEFFNLLNQHAFQTPGEILGASGFGFSSATVLPERQIQFALRLIF